MKHFIGMALDLTGYFVLFIKIDYASHTYNLLAVLDVCEMKH